MTTHPCKIQSSEKLKCSFGLAKFWFFKKSIEMNQNLLFHKYIGFFLFILYSCHFSFSQLPFIIFLPHNFDLLINWVLPFCSFSTQWSHYLFLHKFSAWAPVLDCLILSIFPNSNSQKWEFNSSSSSLFD